MESLDWCNKCLLAHRGRAAPPRPTEQASPHHTILYSVHNSAVLEVWWLMIVLYQRWVVLGYETFKAPLPPLWPPYLSAKWWQWLRQELKTIVIATQSQDRAAKVGLSREIEDVTKNSQTLKKFLFLLKEVFKYHLTSSLRKNKPKLNFENCWSFLVTSICQEFFGGLWRYFSLRGQ